MKSPDLLPFLGIWIRCAMYNIFTEGHPLHDDDNEQKQGILSENLCNPVSVRYSEAPKLPRHLKGVGSSYDALVVVDPIEPYLRQYDGIARGQFQPAIAYFAGRRPL